MKILFSLLFIIAVLKAQILIPSSYDVSFSRQIPYLQQVAINSEASIMATVTSELTGVLLTVQYYEGQTKINSTSTPIQEEYFISWILSISGEGTKIALLQFNTKTVLIFERDNQGNYKKVQVLNTTGLAQNLILSQDGSLLSLGDYNGLAQIYKFNDQQKKFNLLQQFNIKSDLTDPNTIAQNMYECKISKTNKVLIFEGQYMNISAKQQRRTAFLYTLDEATSRYVYSNQIKIDSKAYIYDIQLSQDSSTIFIKTNGYPQIYKKQNDGNYTFVQTFKDCWNNGVQNLELSDDGKLAFILCNKPINTTLVYKLNQANKQYEMIQNIEKTKGDKILISKDGEKLFIVNSKQFLISMISAHCPFGQYFFEGYCASCSNIFKCENSSFKTIFLSVLIPFILIVIISVITGIMCYRRYKNSSEDTKTTSSDDKKKNLTELQINDSNIQIEEASIYSYISQIGKTDAKCLICNKSKITHFTPCLHFFHYQCIANILEKINHCPICKSPLELTRLNEIHQRKQESYISPDKKLMFLEDE